jgi:hypothetical protein
MFPECPGAPEKSALFFGLEPIKFRGLMGYSEFLYSLTDNQFLPRDGEVLATDSFLDGRTAFMTVIHPSGQSDARQREYAVSVTNQMPDSENMLYV